MRALHILAVFLLLGLFAAPLAAPSASAADAVSGRVCLTKGEQRMAVLSGRAIPLVRAVRVARERGHWGELVRVTLCRRDERLVYVLTLLPRNGRVVRVAVDAGNGDLIGSR
jgi:uncharacterized membrane protein YkoI